MNHNRLPLLFLLLLPFGWLPSFAQFNQQKFITYTTADGLTDNYVMKVVTDKKGFTWAATRNGISRFDGLTFTNYSAAQGLRSSWVTDVLTDNGGTVWVSTEWGLCYYNEPADRFVYLNPMNEVVVLYTGPLHLQGDVLWMAAENGLLKVDTKTKHYSLVAKGHIPDPQCITTDASGGVWIGTRGHGFYTWENNRLQHRQQLPLAADAHIMDFYRDGDGLWCATSEGLLKLEGEEAGTLYRAGPGNTLVDALTFVTAYPVAGDSLLLCGTYNKRVAFFNKRQRRFTQVFSGSNTQMHGLPDAIIHDGSSANGLLWIGSDKGLTLLSPHRQDYAAYLLNGNALFERALVKKMFPVVAEPQKRWLVLNNPGCLALYNTITHTVERTWTAAAPRFYEAAMPTPDGGFYLLHQKGIDRFSPSAGITAVYTEKAQRFFSITADDKANLWVGTDDGLLRYATTSGKADYFKCRFTGTPVENNSFGESFLAKNVVADKQNRVWIASNKYGLFCFDVQRQTFTPYRQPSTAAYETKNRCGSLVFDEAGRLWIGNASGLSRFDTVSKTFYNYNGAQGLQSSYVYALAADAQGNVIGRGNSGVFQFSLARQTFTNHPVPVGMSASLLDQEVSIINGQAVVGFEGGFTVYQPPQQLPQNPPSVFINSFHARSQRLQHDALVVLSHQQNDLRIDFAAVDYAHPEGITYRYRLSGRDDAWVNIGRQRSVQLTELSPGDYRFEVVALTANGLQSSPALLRFKIQPPFWQTGLFLTGLAVAVAVLLWHLYRQRVRRLQQRQQLEIEAYKQQLELEQITSFFSSALLDKQTADEVLNEVAKNLIARLGFENCMIYRWDEKKEVLVQRGGYGIKGALESIKHLEHYDLSKNQGIVGATVATAAPILVNNTAKDSRYFSADGIVSGSELCVPIIDAGAVLGAINLEQTQKGFFTNRHLQTVSTIAALVANKLRALEQTEALHQKELDLADAGRRITETELGMLRSQMNPHFIFNSLNSIQKYIWESKQEDAAEYLTKFARLIRSILENSAQKLVSLQKEMASLKLYLELEHRRSNQKFDYHLSVDECLDTATVQIPPLLLQPYIENAIWHGLNTKPQHGQLMVSIHSKEGQLICVIDDDGIGRHASQQLKRDGHVSMGLNISHQRVKLLQQETGVAADVVITDKQNRGASTGTTVTITLPLIQHYA